MQHSRHRAGARAVAVVGVVGMALAGCGGDGTSSAGDPTTASVAAVPTAAPTTVSATTASPPTVSSTTVSPATQPATTPPATQVATSAQPTTAGTTVPAGPPVFDPRTLGDNRALPSLVLTVTVANTNGGQLNETVTTTGFIKEPLSAYELATYSYAGTTDGLRRYLVNGRSYEENQFGDWYLFEAGSRAAPDYSDGLDLRAGTLAGVLTADFAGEAELAGIAANHFVFDETDLANYSAYSPDNPSPTVGGDFYLAREGNYILATHSKESSPGRTYEVTEALSSIGQVGEIALPAELAPMTQALDLGVELAGLLPPGAALSAMVRYRNGIGVDYYTYRASVRTNDELLAFYRALPPTNGWSVSHIGHVKPHLEKINCETSVDCVIMRNGGEQIVVSFGGTITIEHDHQHVFSPV